MQPARKPQRKFCTTREAAEILGVSLKTAQLWSESGLLEAWRTEGGHRRIYRESVERLLFKANPSPGEADKGTAGQEDEAFNVLVAEDEDSLRNLYALRLRTWKFRHTVTFAASGIEALLAIGRMAPDLLITDLKMPEMDGFRMLHTLRRMPEFAHMAIVVVTGLDAEEIHARGGLPEDVRVFPKPIPFERIEQLAEEIATARKAARKA